MAPRRPPPTRRRRRRTPAPAKLPYSAQDRLITPAELRFLHTGLEPALKDRHGKDRFYIGVQVPLTSLIKVEDEHWDRIAGRKIRQKRVDFVLAYPKTFRIGLAIELDDKSHELPDRKRRDEFVEEAFAAAGLPLLRFPIYRKYDPDKIRSIINRELKQYRDKCKGESVTP